MRIAVVEPTGRGGMIHYAFQLCRGLQTAGAEVTLVTSCHYELDALDHSFELLKLLRLWDPKPADRPLPRGSFDMLRRKLRRAGRALRYYREWLRLAGYLRRARPDVVQFGDVRFAGDLVCLLVLRAAGLTLADVCHNVHPLAAGGTSAGLFHRGRLTRAVYRRIYGLFAAVFVHYEANRREFLAAHGVAPERVAAIPHGHERLFAELRDPRLGPAALRRRWRLPQEEPVVLFFGTLTRYKGIDLLLEAFARIRRQQTPATLVIAGFPAADFDLEAHRNLAIRLAVEPAVRFAGHYLPSQEVAAWMELAAVAVFPYRAIFQSGALLVAQSFGVPVVASRVGAMEEAVRHGETGLLVPPADAGALAAAISRILREPELAAELGRRAAAESLERCSWERIGGVLVERYRALVRARTGREEPP